MANDMNNEIARPQLSRRSWRWFLQFNLRSLLLLVTAAAVGCWWFLQPRTRDELLGGTPLRMRRQVRVVKYEESKHPAGFREVELIDEGGQRFQVVNEGRWRLYDPKGNLLVDGVYKSDQAHGKWTIYHSNGRKAAEGMLTEGRKVGLWKTWDEEGRVIGEVDYAERGKGDENSAEGIPRIPEGNFFPPVVGILW